MRPFLLLLVAALVPLSAQEDEKTDPGPEYRKFTAATGKTLRAKVVARLDEKTYTFETPEGKTYKMALSSFSQSDQQWLEFWQPEFATDLSTLETDDALTKMGFTAVSMTNPDIGMLIEVTVGDAELKLLFDPKAKNTILDVEPADRAGLTIVESNTVFNDAAGNKTKAKQATNAPFTFGDAETMEATVLVIDLALIGGANIQKEADGILGGDLLPNLNALVDFNGKVLYVKP
jgi:hypothetical protein